MLNDTNTHKDEGARNDEGERRTRDRCPVCNGAGRDYRRVVRAGEVAVCGTCGSWYRVPRPTFEELGEIYDRGYYDSWGLGETGSVAELTKRATFLPLLKRVGKLLGETRPEASRILDVGAATGLLLEVARGLGHQPHAVEVNPYAADRLRNRFGAEAVFEGQLPDCPFARRTFDVITMTDLIEHVLDVKATLRTANRLLRPGGVLCITTPRIDSMSRRVMGANWLHFKAEHIQYFSRQGMETALRNAAFTDVQVSPSPKYLTFDYLHLQLRTYPHRLLSPLVYLAHRLTPETFHRRPLPYLCGEMLVTAGV